MGLGWKLYEFVGLSCRNLVLNLVDIILSKLDLVRIVLQLLRLFVDDRSVVRLS